MRRAPSHAIRTSSEGAAVLTAVLTVEAAARACMCSPRRPVLTAEAAALREVVPEAPLSAAAAHCRRDEPPQRQGPSAPPSRATLARLPTVQRRCSRRRLRPASHPRRVGQAAQRLEREPMELTELKERVGQAAQRLEREPTELTELTERAQRLVRRTHGSGPCDRHEGLATRGPRALVEARS